MLQVPNILFNHARTNLPKLQTVLQQPTFASQVFTFDLR